jgi:tetratricopeptide (TPR) repeat protein
LAEALDVHQQAAALAPADDPDLNAAIYAEIATVLNEQEQFNGAVEAGFRAVNWLERSKHADPALKARILSNLGRSSYELGQFERAHQFYLGGLAAASDAESLYRIANAQMSLGVTARATGRLDEAVEHCNRALEIWSRIRQERSANRVLNNMGDVYYAQGKKAEARLIQQQCLERAQQLHDDLEIGIAGGALARYALESGDAAEALRLASASAEAARRDGALLHEASAIGIQAAAAEQLGQRRVADRSFRQAISLLLEREAGAKLAQLCTLYAEALRGRGQHDRAFAVMRSAAARDFASLRRLITPRK